MKIIGIGLIILSLYFLQVYLYKKVWKNKLQVHITFAQKYIVEGEEGEIQEIITNGKLLPIPVLKVKFQTSKSLHFQDALGSKTTDQFYRNEIFQIGSKEKITRKLTFRAEKRGYYQIREIDLIGTDLFLSIEMIEIGRAHV